MSLEIFPTYPKIRADQIEGVDTLVTSIINDETSQIRAILDTIIRNAVASAFNYRGHVNGVAVNWNELTEPGYYLITIELSKEVGSNFPPVSIQGGVLLVMTTESGRISQIFFGDYGALAYRYYDGSEWRPWFGRSGSEVLWRLHGEEILGSDTYRALVSFIPSDFIWPGSSGVIPVRVFGQMLYQNESSSTTYIRIRKSSSSSGLAIVEATLSGTYSIVLPIEGISTDEELIVEHRTTPPDPSKSPRLKGLVDDTPATYFTFLF